MIEGIKAEVGGADLIALYKRSAERHYATYEELTAKANDVAAARLKLANVERPDGPSNSAAAELVESANRYHDKALRAKAIGARQEWIANHLSIGATYLVDVDDLSTEFFRETPNIRDFD